MGTNIFDFSQIVEPLGLTLLHFSVPRQMKNGVPLAGHYPDLVYWNATDVIGDRTRPDVAAMAKKNKTVAAGLMKRSMILVYSGIQENDNLPTSFMELAQALGDEEFKVVRLDEAFSMVPKLGNP